MREDVLVPPIRVAQVIGKMAQAGVDTMVMNHYRRIDREKVQFDFFIDGLDPTPFDDEIISLGGRIFKLPAYSDNIRGNLKAFRKILSMNHYKIIHCHMNTLSVFWLREAKKAGVSVRIVHNHSTSHWREGKRTLLKYMLRPLSKKYATNYLACGEYSGRWLFGNRMVDAGEVMVIPVSVDPNTFKFDSAMRERVRHSLRLNGKFVIGHVGRFIPQKNHKFLIKVFAEVIKQKPNVVLLLIGDGALKQDIERLVDGMGLKDSVIILGSMRDIHELYQAMDVFTLPSLYEGFPAVLIEAQTVGLPCVVSSKVTEEALIPGASIRCELHTDKWIQAILASTNAQRRDRSGEIIEKGHDIARTVERLQEFYVGLDDRRPGKK